MGLYLFVNHFFRNFAAMKKALLYFLAFVIVQLVTGSVFATMLSIWHPDEALTPSSRLMLMSAVSFIICLVLFLSLKWYKVGGSYIRTRPWSAILWTTFLAFGIIIPLAWLEEQLPDSMTQNLLADEMQQMLKSTNGYFLICMLVPLTEEIIFRGAITGSLQRWLASPDTVKAPSLMKRHPALFAVLISSLLFSLGHMNPAQMPHAFVVGLLMGWLYVKTDSILLCFLVHWINNSSGFVLARMFPLIPIDAKLTAYFGGNTTAVAQAVICSLLIALPSLYQLHMLFKMREVKK